MSIEEPTEIGTIMQRPDGKRFAVLLDPPEYPWRLYEAPDTYLSWVPWHDIKDWNLVHRGWTPPTPEPMHHGARVIDAGELRCVRVWDEDGSVDGRPWASPRGELWAWSDLRQPVTVVSDGNDW